MGRKKSLQSSEVIAAINRWLVDHGVAPTIRELRQVLGVKSQRTVLRYLKELEDAEEIERWPGARGLRLLRMPKRGLETVAIPVVGEAPAGPLMVAEENIESWVRVAKDQLKPALGKCFLLRVRGDSMNRAKLNGNAIESGDLVLVRQQSTAESGAIVVAIVDGQATIKRFSKADGYFVLKPESTNTEHRPVLVRGRLLINGVVCEVLKRGSHALGMNQMIEDDRDKVTR